MPPYPIFSRIAYGFAISALLLLSIVMGLSGTLCVPHFNLVDEVQGVAFFSPVSAFAIYILPATTAVLLIGTAVISLCLGKVSASRRTTAIGIVSMVALPVVIVLAFASVPSWGCFAP